jgi:hypothetical protein
MGGDIHGINGCVEQLGKLAKWNSAVLRRKRFCGSEATAPDAGKLCSFDVLQALRETRRRITRAQDPPTN